MAVEFVHPVIVGKRALPAIGLAGEGGELAAQVALLALPDDIAIAFGADEDGGEAARALALARARGCLTIAFSPAGGEYEFEPPSDDPHIRQELVETLYHLLWELVHVFFDHRGLLAGRDARRVHDAGASSFLYPFLGEQEHELEPVVDDVRRSVLMKAQEIGALRVADADRQPRDADAAPPRRCARASSAAESCSRWATAARRPTRWTPSPTSARRTERGRGRPAIDLTEDPAILTAIANDIGTEAIFSRQVIAYGAAGDALLAFSTSGNSRNVIEALAEARRRGLVTIAMVGYDGGAIAGDGLADHVVVTRSEHIPRIQEAQASAYHALQGARRMSVRAPAAAGAGAPGCGCTAPSRESAFAPTSTAWPASSALERLRAQRLPRRLLEVEGAGAGGRPLPRPPAARGAAARRARARRDGGARADGRRRLRDPREPARRRRRRAGHARQRDLRAVPERALRPRRPPLPLPVHQLHQLRPAVHDHPRRPLRPPADDDGRLHDVRALPGGVRGPRRPALPRPAERLPAVRARRSRCSTPRGDAVAAAGARDLRAGGRAGRCATARIVAVKGIGGFHLACRADDEAAVAALRARKHREDKPFALMAGSLEAAGSLVALGAQRARAADRARSARSCSRPRVAGAPVADSVAPGSRELGVMLPYSPLHHLLLADAGTTLVMTSGNLLRRADRLPRRRRARAARRLADLFLLHDRPIQTRTDDSVVRVVAVAGRARARRSCAARAATCRRACRCPAARRHRCSPAAPS